jgi:hypothetical protein
MAVVRGLTVGCFGFASAGDGVCFVGDNGGLAGEVMGETGAVEGRARRGREECACTSRVGMVARDRSSD